jgi:hypothetical protein
MLGGVSHRFSRFLFNKKYRLETSVADPDSEPDPYVFGPPGSGSFYQQARKTLIPTF